MSYYTEIYHLGRTIAGWARLGALQRYRQMRGRWEIEGDSTPFSISKLQFFKEVCGFESLPFHHEINGIAPHRLRTLPL
jgi:hypothetical protein